MPEAQTRTSVSDQAKASASVSVASDQHSPRPQVSPVAVLKTKTNLPAGALQAVAHLQSAHTMPTAAAFTAKTTTAIFPPPQPVNPHYRVNIHRPVASATTANGTTTTTSLRQATGSVAATAATASGVKTVATPASTSRSALIRRASAVSDGPVINNRLAVETAGSVVAASIRGTAAANAGVIPAALAQEEAASQKIAADAPPVVVSPTSSISDVPPKNSVPATPPQARIPSPTRRDDWRIGGEQNTTQKVGTVFSGQASVEQSKQETVGQNTGSNLHQEEPQDPLAKAAVAYHPMPQGRRWGFNWPLLAAGGIVVVFAIALVGRFAGLSGEKRESKKTYLSDDVMNMDVAEYEHCATRVSAEVQQSVVDAVATIEATYTPWEPEAGDENMFDFWIKPAMQADGNACTRPFDCMQDLSVDAYFQGSVIANHYGQDTSLAVGQKVPAQNFYALQRAVFGDGPEADLSRYPELEYDAATATFSVPAPKEDASAYTFVLEKVYENGANDEVVYVAKMKPSDECSLDILGDRCFCPQARYFLIMRYDEASDRWYYRQVMVQQLEQTYDLDMTGAQAE